MTTLAAYLTRRVNDYQSGVFTSREPNLDKPELLNAKDAKKKKNVTTKPPVISTSGARRNLHHAQDFPLWSK